MAAARPRAGAPTAAALARSRAGRGARRRGARFDYVVGAALDIPGLGGVHALEPAILHLEHHVAAGRGASTDVGRADDPTCGEVVDAGKRVEEAGARQAVAPVS